MQRIAVETTAVAVLADGTSLSDTSNRRGRLLEEFVALLLGTLGYDEPHREQLNVTKEGIELDVVATHRVTNERILCECKAYSTNIRAPLLTSFLGKYALAKADDPTCHGLFVGLPRLTPEAREQATAAETKLRGFRYIGSYELCKLLGEAGLLPSLDDGPNLKADPTLVISEHGMALAACELETESRRPYQWSVWASTGTPPDALLQLVERFLSDGLPVTAHGSDSSIVPVRAPAASTIVEVQGSTSDFEYQLPASPAFFVGRKQVASDLRSRVIDRSNAGSIVINAKSGWGKSSISLWLQKEVDKAGGVSMIVDARTAERTDFVTTAMEKLITRAVDKKLIRLPEDAAFSSIQSIVETSRNIEWRTATARPLMIVFDQFENVFRDYELTREFRDLALLVKQLPVPISVGYCWKTDVVGLTEDYPYALRDEIRGASHVVSLDPLGPREVETLLRRLEKAVGNKLHRELRQRLREYSQGLPWLFKKLAGHIIAEVERGVTQEQLIKQSLNVQVLFEADLAQLAPNEQEALRAIARSAPVLVSEIDNSSIPGEVLSSLLHQRLIVQVGDRLDTYWDTFRDFLTTGRVAIEDSYIVRYAPRGGGRLLRTIVAAGGDISVPDAAKQLDTSATVVFNYARELRLFGVLTTEANRLVIEPDVMLARDREEEIRNRVAQALRRHKMYTLALELMTANDDVLPVANLAVALPTEFPTVEAKADSWFTYARSFCQWLEYAGLTSIREDGTLIPSDDRRSATSLLSGQLPVRVRSVFPGGNPGPSLQLLRHLADPTQADRPSKNGFRLAVRDLLLLDAIERDAGNRISLRHPELVVGATIDAARLRELVERQRGMAEAFDRLVSEPSCPPAVLGELHRAALGADWAESTVLSVGKFLRAWARACGIATRAKPPRARTDRRDRPAHRVRPSE